MSRSLPIKIDPDNIKESIVQVMFSTEVPNELLPGYFHQLFAESFEYSANAPDFSELFKFPIPINITQSRPPIFSNKEIKFQLEAIGGITFNTNERYIGWDNYFPQIEKVLTVAFENGIIKDVTRIGIRYISEYEDGVYGKINLKLDLPIWQEEPLLSNFKFENETDGFSVVLGVRSVSTEFQERKNQKISSIIDVDVVKNGINLNELNQVLDFIGRGRKIGKKTFFNLLTEEYVSTLKPQFKK